MAIKNIAIVGGAGALGSSLLKALTGSGKFNTTAISRPSSTAAFPSSVKVLTADYTSVEALTLALRGQDALVLAVGAGGLAGQSVFVDAAIAAGVQRIIPSEFGSDVGKASAMPVYGYKIATRKHLEERIANGAVITYTYVINGSFLDWGLEHNFLLNWKSAQPTFYNDGKFVFSATTLASVGQAVVGVLSHPEETKNRSVYVEDLVISQSKLLDLARKVAPSKEWDPINVNLADLERSANERLAKGDYSLEVMCSYLCVVCFQEGYGSRFEKLDNELLGVKGKTEADVEEIWKVLLASNYDGF
ncbi:hypothetical protein PZA11_006522 [Diplocarpon coronariae]|uniref:Isoflavone reductase family protein CipA n=1 Tax=Diplocarpon coronariae TaxID=2795749 RepID=A0A218ZCI1_9HELO|nr:isoflavone reductase family protein CipA [Marssonina coronariae]